MAHVSRQVAQSGQVDVEADDVKVERAHHEARQNCAGDCQADDRGRAHCDVAAACRPRENACRKCERHDAGEPQQPVRSGVRTGHEPDDDDEQQRASPRQRHECCGKHHGANRVRDVEASESSARSAKGPTSKAIAPAVTPAQPPATRAVAKASTTAVATASA